MTPWTRAGIGTYFFRSDVGEWSPGKEIGDTDNAGKVATVALIDELRAAKPYTEGLINAAPLGSKGWVYVYPQPDAPLVGNRLSALPAPLILAYLWVEGSWFSSPYMEVTRWTGNGYVKALHNVSSMLFLTV